MRIFLDANILFSAAKSDGAVRCLLQRLHTDGHALCADGYVVAEARRNLQLKAPDSESALDNLLADIDVALLQAGEPPPEVAAALPEKDWPVFAAAVRLGCDALVAGDRTHFGRLYGTTVRGVTIHSLRSLAEAVLTNTP